MLRAFGNDLGFVTLVIYGCSALYVVGLAADGGARRQHHGRRKPADHAVADGRRSRLLGASGASPVFEFGHWWTVLSASWLHGSVLHILFNMLWVRQLGPATADIYGPGRMVIIYTLPVLPAFSSRSTAGYVLGLNAASRFCRERT